MIYLTVEDLVRIAEAATNGKAVVRDIGLLSASVARPQTHVFDHDPYPDIWSKAGALLHSVARNHPLIDGNKRLAWTAARVFLHINGIRAVPVDVDVAERLVMSVAEGTLDEVGDIARELRKLYL